jgi:proprotein convertase subtilisin/kexin type 5
MTLVTSKSNTSNGFTLFTYSSNGYLVQQGSTNIWYPKCFSTVCRDCSNSTFCINCYNDTSITANVVLKNNTCAPSCPDIGFFVVNLVCQLCDPNCYKCTGSSKNCTQCTGSLYLDSTTNSCVSVCPDKYYSVNSTLQCSPCISPCVNCISNTSCISCQSGWFLFGNSCLVSCPVDTYIQNSANNTCDPCSSNCLTCINFTFQCKSCDTTKPLYLQPNTSTCVANCTGGLVPKAGVCSPCDSPCLTCSVTSTNCTSCNGTSANPLLYNNLCIQGP